MAKTSKAAEELRLIRAGLDLTQEAMADAIGTSFRTYQRWESGESRVTADALLAAQKLRDSKLKKKRGA